MAADTHLRKAQAPGGTQGLPSLWHLAGLLLLFTCVYSLVARDAYEGDFRAYYVAAQVSHAGLDPYLNQVNIDEKYADRDWLQVNSRFIYPPSALLLFAPFGRASYKTAKVVYGTGLALVMVAVLLVLVQRHPRRWWMALVLFCSLPMLANIDNGQVDVLVLALTLAVFWAQRSWLGGVCLGIAIAIKMSPVLVVGWLLATRRWAAAGWALATSAALTLIAVQVSGCARYIEWFQHLRAHLGPNPTLLKHTFTQFPVLYGRFVLMGQNTYSMHFFYGGRQNPLPALAGLGLVLVYLGWVAAKKADTESSFYGFLVVALLVNSLLWPSGLVACFPLMMWIIARTERAGGWALALLAPFYLPLEVIAGQRFLVWVTVFAAWLWWQWKTHRTALTALQPAPSPQEI